LQLVLPEINRQGANLVAISPQLPDQSISMVKKNHLEFPLLSDVGNTVAKKFGLVFTLPKELRPVYKNFNVDLEKANGDNRFELPVPASYIIDQNGMILHSFVEEDHTKRLEPSVIIDVLKKNAGKS
jgi:peroxiredoxin